MVAFSAFFGIKARRKPEKDPKQGCDCGLHTGKCERNSFFASKSEKT